MCWIKAHWRFILITGILSREAQRILWSCRLYSLKFHIFVPIFGCHCCLYREYYLFLGQISVRIFPLCILLHQPFPLHFCHRELHDGCSFTSSQLLDGNNNRSWNYCKETNSSLRLCLDNRYGEWFSKGRNIENQSKKLSASLLHKSKHSLNLFFIFIFCHALTRSRVLCAGNNDDDRWFFPFAGWPSQTILALPDFIHQLWGMGFTGIYFNHGDCIVQFIVNPGKKEYFRIHY